MSSFGATDPYDRGTVVAMIQTLRPAWGVDAVSACERGTDALYFASVSTESGAREVVVKAAEFVDAERFCREPELVAYVDEHTDIPVPSIVGIVADHVTLPTPYFLMDRVEGTDGTDLPDPTAGESLNGESAGEMSDGESDGVSDRWLRLARDSGRYLAALHEQTAGEVSGFGFVDATGDSLSVASDTTTLSAAYRTHLTELAREGLSEGRFADLAPTIADVAETVAAKLPEVTPAVLHNDWRPGNLLVDPDTGELVAALDWGAPVGGHHEHELAKVEQSLSGEAGPDAPVRLAVRRALYDGYESRRSLDRDADFEWRREAYLFSNRVTAMRWLPHWHADAADAERDRVASQQCDALAVRLSRLTE